MTFQFSRTVEATGLDVRVAVLSVGAETVGFFPYQYSSLVSRLIGRAERVGGEMSDYCGVIAKAGTRLDEVEILKLAHLQFFDFSHLQADQIEMGLTATKHETGHLIRISSTGPDYWKSLAQKDRRLTQDTIRCISKFEREIGALEFNADVLGRTDLLEMVIRMKREQYQRTDVGDALSEEWRRRLMHLLYTQETAGCRGIISTITCGPDLVAAHFGLIAGGTLHYWFPVYEQKYSKYSPGRLLYKYLIESMDRMGLKVIDHGAGDAAYKIALSNEAYKVYSGRWRRRSPFAFMSLATNSIESRAHRLLKKR